MSLRCIKYLVLLLAFFVADVASAQEFTFYVGHANPGSVEVDNLTVGLDGSAVYGFRLSTSFVPAVGLEHTIAFSSDFLRPEGLPADFDVKGFIYSSNLIVNLRIGNATPYLTAGVGLIRQYGSPGLPIGAKFATNYGGGLKLPRLKGPLGLRFDARGYTTTNVFSKNVSIFELTAGVLLSFGR